MNWFISTLVTGTDEHSPELEAFAETVSGWGEPDLGVELVAFTHDRNYWHRLLRLLPKLSCPRTFHGPWLGVEVTSEPESEEGQWLRRAYRNVFRLAASFKAWHVVVHYSQRHFTEATHRAAQEHAYRNLGDLLELAESLGVCMTIENLAQSPAGGIHLFTNEEYFELFERFPRAHAIIDLGHAQVNGLDVEKFLATYGERCTAFHVHSNDGVHDSHWDMHEGVCDIPAAMKWARRYTPNAAVILEYEPHVRKTPDELRAQIEELRRM